MPVDDPVLPLDVPAPGETPPPRRGMSVLVVDNDDSFTFNLVDLIRSHGCRVDVVDNRQQEVLDRLDQYDAVVLSPGPGSPHLAEDIGICRALLEGQDIPVLGVCLGHQVMVAAAGGQVDRADQPRHGLIEDVVHDGSGVFAGVPSPMPAMRYHSLVAVSVPESLVVTGRGPGDQVQAVTHRHRPWWGVQFHPESVGTPAGAVLVGNFLSAAAAWNQQAGRVVQRGDSHSGGTPTLGAAELTCGAAVSTPPWTMTHQTVALAVDPAVLQAQLYQLGAPSFWLDSSDAESMPVTPEQPGSRWSFLGDAQGPLARVATYDLTTSVTTVTDRAGTQHWSGEFLDFLATDMASLPQCELADGMPPYVGGWVGFLGYELKAECGAPRRAAHGHPEAAMIFADRCVAYEHDRGRWHLVSWSDPSCREEQDRWASGIARLLRQLAEEAAPAPPAPHPPPLSVRARHSQDEYVALVAQAQELIAAGQSSEICLTSTLTATPPPHFAADLPGWYSRLRQANPAPYAAWVSVPGVTVLSTSPECFLTISPSGEVTSEPIKGTRPRNADPTVDAQLRADLTASVKDRAENLMIVDLVRHDLTRTALPGSTRVAELCAIRSYATVHQMVSVVASQIGAQDDRVGVLRAAFPPGSMTGAPKLRTMSLIDDLEQAPRGVYSGALGYLSLSGAVDMSVVIRSVVAVDDELRYGVGGAVTALSVPQEEFDETMVKARPLLRWCAVDQVEGG
ncbi:Isochorismate synthase MenF [Austwickia sp. TVS 96-490-7B]|uniref:chorismate-binding protein n=1 Tax=Austwickia sp. TVS 96-490-7B TaxID=2830843 RepID=UPI001C572C25|nr:chorismate-binding protein [Austwickia sp. TVS 96-490-7B]MBW3085025.1 Isochorismate synthase MenF [Austwickia sp. TVS 96-490-7B]